MKYLGDSHQKKMNKTLNLLKKLQKVGNVKSEFKDILSVFYKNLKIFL